jgi:hypothetical protein
MVTVVDAANFLPELAGGDELESPRFEWRLDFMKVPMSLR